MKSIEAKTAEFRVFVSYYYSHPNTSNCDEAHTSPRTLILHARGSTATVDNDQGYGTGKVFEGEFVYLSVFCYCEMSFWFSFRFHKFEIKRVTDAQKERNNPFTDFLKKHGEKFSFLGGEHYRRPIGSSGATLSAEEQDMWKKLYYEKKAKQEKKLKLFQRMGDIKVTSFSQIEGLSMKPFMQEILVQAH